MSSDRTDAEWIADARRLVEQTNVMFSTYESRHMMAALVRELDKAQDALKPKPLREDLVPHAYLLENTYNHARYWLEGGRDDPRRGHAVLAVEQAVNSWMNAAYAMAERVHAAGQIFRDLLKTAENERRSSPELERAGDWLRKS